jgi:hypothetical protein
VDFSSADQSIMLWLILSITALLVALGAFGVLVWRSVDVAKVDQTVHDELAPRLQEVRDDATKAASAVKSASTKDPVGSELRAIENEVGKLKDRVADLNIAIVKTLDAKKDAQKSAAAGIASRTADVKELGEAIGLVTQELQEGVTDLQGRLTTFLTSAQDLYNKQYFKRANEAYTTLKQVLDLLPTLDNIKGLLLEGETKRDLIRTRVAEYLSTSEFSSLQTDMTSTTTALTTALDARRTSLATLDTTFQQVSACAPLYTSAQALDARLNGSSTALVTVADQLCFSNGKCLTKDALKAKLDTLA